MYPASRARQLIGKMPKNPRFPRVSADDFFKSPTSLCNITTSLSFGLQGTRGGYITFLGAHHSASVWWYQGVPRLFLDTSHTKNIQRCKGI